MALQEDLLAVLRVRLIFIYHVQPLSVAQSTVPSSHEEPLSVDLSNSQPICMHGSSNLVFVLTKSCEVNTSIIFWSSEAFVDERVAFQLSLTAPSDVVISALPFSSLAIYFSHKEQPIIVHHNASATSASKFQRVDLGDLPLEIAIERGGCLRWEKDATILFVGTVSSDVPLTMTVCSYCQQISHV
jgi:hypothetical protein